MSAMGSPYHWNEYGDEYRDEYGEDPAWSGPEPTWGEELSGTVGYLGGILTGPVLPLIVYLAGRNFSGFVRGHTAQALNVTLTVLLYAISGTIVGVLLSFDSSVAALAVMVPIAAVVWLIMVVHLVRGAVAAVRGEFVEMPAWICARLVS
jgi:hypothetical protein